MKELTAITLEMNCDQKCDGLTISHVCSISHS
jgi:hypothetical protein